MTATEKTSKLNAKLAELLAEWDTATQNDRYWLAMEIEGMEKKIENLAK